MEGENYKIIVNFIIAFVVGAATVCLCLIAGMNLQSIILLVVFTIPIFLLALALGLYGRSEVPE